VLNIAAFTVLTIKECGHGIYNNYGNNFQYNVKKDQFTAMFKIWQNLKILQEATIKGESMKSFFF
jgi:hypothetical protein